MYFTDQNVVLKMPKTGENGISLAKVFQFTQGLVCRTVPRVEYILTKFFVNFVGPENA